MGLRFDPNLNSLGAQRQLNQATDRQVRGLQALASGLRINRAADDASGLAIAEALRSQVIQDNAEIGNLQSAINVADTADAAIGTQQDAVGRLQELATQAANGTLTDDQRAAINEEAQQLLDQINDTANNTEFNGQQLINGTNPQVNVGTESGEQLNLPTSTTTSLGLDGLDLSTQGGAQAALDQIQNAQDQIANNRASLGAQANAFGSAIEERQNSALNSQAAESQIRDLDVARQSIEQSRNSLRQQLSIFALVNNRIAPEAAAQLLGG
jgi:flagellin